MRRRALNSYDKINWKQWNNLPKNSSVKFYRARELWPEHNFTQFKVVPSDRQKYKIQNWCFVFCILSRDKTGPKKLWENFVSISCFVAGQKNETKLKTQISSRFCLRSTTTIESDKIQNTKFVQFCFFILSTIRNDLTIQILTHPSDFGSLHGRTILNSMNGCCWGQCCVPTTDV